MSNEPSKANGWDKAERETSDGPADTLLTPTSRCLFPWTANDPHLLAAKLAAERRRLLADSTSLHNAMAMRFAGHSSLLDEASGGEVNGTSYGSETGSANLSAKGRQDSRERLNEAGTLKRQYSSNGCSSGSSDGCDMDGSEKTDQSCEREAVLLEPTQWTYEEQFKQLYVMGEEPGRKPFLDDLFLFMQKKGLPVNRIPVMAKQTLDLYKLFKLVIEKGGLVEVINKKLWREITKGLNLPSSITSAAFTLRTQYMKFLYPYECEKFAFSTPAELQSAIDGNKREGRRPNYLYDTNMGNVSVPFLGAQSLPSVPFLSPSLLSNSMMNMLAGAQFRPNFMLPGNRQPGSGHMTSGSINMAGKHAKDVSFLQSVSSENTNPRRLESPPPLPSSVAMSRLRQPGVASALAKDVKRMQPMATARLADEDPATSPLRPPPFKLSKTDERTVTKETGGESADRSHDSHSTGDTSEEGHSVLVSMELNGSTYQGFLFAQTGRKRDG